MKDGLSEKIITCLSNRKQKKKIIALISVLSVIVSTSVYGALMVPAVSMTDSEIHLSAPKTETELGESLTLHVSAVSGTDNIQSGFCILSSGGDITPAEESLHEETLDITTEDGSTLTMEHILTDNGDTVYYFTMDSGRSAEFTLDFIPGNLEGNNDILTTFSAAVGTDRESALAAARAETDTLSLVWKTETEDDEEIIPDEEPVESSTGTEIEEQISPEPEIIDTVPEEQITSQQEDAYTEPEEKIPAAGAVENSLPASPDSSASSSQPGTDGMENNDQGSSPVPADSNPAGIDFGPYITDATFEKVVNGQWGEGGTTFENGEMVRVTIDYHLDTDVINGSNRVITYQLPEGITPTAGELTGFVQSSIKGSTNTVGTYSITTDENGTSLITITFDEAFVVMEGGFHGDIMFTAHTYNTGEDKKSVTIGKETITILPQEGETDLSIAKSGTAVDTDNDGNTDHVEYQITVSSTQGTGGKTVSVYDNFITSNTNPDNLDYDKSSIKVIKKSADGNQTPITLPDGQPVFTTGSNNLPAFNITGLPALEAGESYEITYQTGNIETLSGSSDGEMSVTNSAYGQYENNQRWTWNTVPISKRLIQKTGEYNPATGEISWTIIINPEGREMKGYEIKDTMTGNDGESIELPEEVTITKINPENPDDRSNSKKIKLPYTFDEENDTATYEITYTTKAPEGEQGTTDLVHNTATLTPPEGSKNPVVSTEETIPVYHAEAALNKYFNRVDQVEDSMEMLQWGSVITIPEGGTEDLVYTDTLLNENNEADTNVHFITPQQLKESLKVYAGGAGRTLEAGKDYIITEYFTNGNWTAAEQVQDDTKAAGFKIKFPGKITYDQLTLTYNTTLDHSGLEPGVSQTIRNHGAALDKEDDADYTYTEPKPLDKQVSANGSGENTSYTGEPITVDYRSGILYYRILIRTVDNNQIILTDTLPEGAEYIEGSVGGAFYTNDYSTPSSWTYWKDGASKTYDFNGEQKPSAEVNDRDLIITIPEGYNAYISQDGQSEPISEYRTIMITYQVSVAGDNWADATSHIYQNTVRWEGVGEDSQKTTVTRENDAVKKEGWQTSDETQVLVEYQLEINPAESTLGSGDTLTLTDVFNPGQLSAELLTSSVKLYHYSETAENNRGEEILNTNYQFTYDPATHTIQAVLPDRTHCILTYQYRMNKGDLAGTDFTVNNRAVIEESGEEGDSDDVKISFSDHSASAGLATLSIYKVDAENYAITLPGAEFSLEQWNGTSWDNSNTTITTDGNGRILFEEYDKDSPAEHTLKRDVLYKLTETKAPTGYAKSSTPLYFVWLDHETSGSITLPDNISAGDVHYVATEYGASLFFPNEYTAITVNKRWLDEDGQVMEAPSGSSIQVQLYQQKYQHSGKKVEVTVHWEDGSGWHENTASAYILADASFTVQITQANSNADQPKEFGKVGFKQTGITSAGHYIYTRTYQWSELSPTESGEYTITVGDGSSSIKWVNIADVSITGDSVTNAYEPASDAVPYPDETQSIVTLSASNDWSHTWEKIPKTDESGNPYYYYVQEISSPGGFTSEVENNGIQSGIITVTNRSTGGVKLPETGGIGKTGYTAAGTVLMMTAFLAGGYQLSRKKFKKSRQ